MKRVFDIGASALGLIILAPLFLAVGVSVWIALGRPLIYRQVRPGLNGRRFTLYKFRTMTDALDEHGQPLPDELRLTRFGKFLRATSLDELPQLFNVLRGDMSLVGPRPLLEEYMPLYSSEQARRHEVRPGITGWAQVSGRNALDWRERLAMDIWYVDHRSFLLDMRILWLTLAAVFSVRGVNRDGHATMPKFTGREGRDDV